MSANTEVIRGLYDALAAGDVPTLLAGFDPDIEWTEADTFPTAGTFVGPDAVMQGVFVPLATDMDGFKAVPRELIGSGDVLRRLSLIPVSEAIQPANGAPLADRPAMPLSGDLRAALGLLLESGVPEVAVVDEHGATVGMVNLDAIHERSAPLRAGTAEE